MSKNKVIGTLLMLAASIGISLSVRAQSNTPGPGPTTAAATEGNVASTSGNSADADDVRRALREQQEELKRMRAIIDQQSQVIEQLRQRMDQVAEPGAARFIKTGDIPLSDAAVNGENASAQAGAKAQGSETDARLTKVEEQAKKTSEALAKQLGSITFSGDIRLRYESFYGQLNSLANGANPAILGNELSTRQRFRIRARLAMRGQISKEFDWGLRLASGSFADSISANQTLTDFYNRKPFGLDQAFIAWTPQRVPGLRIQGGKFDVPWTRTELTIDNDLAVEGFSQTYSRNFKNSTLSNLTFVAWELPMLERNSAFVRNANGTVNIEESHRSGRDLALYGAQLRAKFEPTKTVALTLSAADLYFSGTQFISPIQVFGSQLQLPLTITIPATATTPAQTVTTQVSISRDLLVAGNGNLGLTPASTNAINRDGRLASGYNLIDLIGRLDLTKSARFPVTLLFNFVTNTQVHDVSVAGPGGATVFLPNDENNGFWIEGLVGRNKERGDVQFDYTFASIEKDAILTPFNMSDMSQPSDTRMHRVTFNYTVDPRVVFSIIGIINQRPHGLLGAFATTPVGSLNRPTTRLQFDTTFRF
jgi:hypothetical protein